MDLARFVERAAPLHCLGVKVNQHGKLIAEHMFEPDVRRNVYSVSKSFTAVAVGMALEEGILSLEEKLTDAFREDLPEAVCPNLAAATVRDLLTMCLGQDKWYLMGAQRIAMEETDWVRYALAQPFEHAPGSHFQYSNVGPYLASVLIQRRTGMTLVDYLMPRLFAPLGFKLPTWEVDPQGRNQGAGGLMLPLRDLLTFGQFCLQKGRWNGKQLVSAQWMEACMSRQVENGTPWGYGYLFWGGPEGSFRADGAYGQLSIVLEKYDAVIAVASECRDTDSLFRTIFEEIVPQLK